MRLSTGRSGLHCAQDMCKFALRVRSCMTDRLLAVTMQVFTSLLVFGCCFAFPTRLTILNAHNGDKKRKLRQMDNSFRNIQNILTPTSTFNRFKCGAFESFTDANFTESAAIVSRVLKAS